MFKRILCVIIGTKLAYFSLDTFFFKKNASRPPLEFKELYVLAVNDIKIFKHKN